MAFHGNAFYSCFLCGTMHKWFKWMISANPASLKEEEEWPDNVAVFRTDGTKEVLSSGDANEALYAAVESLSLTEAVCVSKPASSAPGRGILSMKVCHECELQWREEVAAEHPEDKEWSQWAEKERVTHDRKQDSKGVQWLVRGQHYPSATGICEWKYAGTKKKQLAARKTEKCKELNEAFLRDIKPGRLLNALLNKGDRMTLTEELQKELQEKYHAYLQKPEGKQRCGP